MRRIKRHNDFEITLQITNDDFIRPPRDAQRNWVVNRALKELSDDLIRLDELASEFVPGSDDPVLIDRTHRQLADDEIMEDWQIPIMRAMANIVTEESGRILEIGFGRGVSATMIQDRGVKSHTIVECNEHVIARCEKWRETYRDRDIRLIQGRWQDVMDQFTEYDGVFFHAYPLDADEFVEHVVQTVTFAEPFFDVASRHLSPGGVFTYLSNEYDSLSRGHQRELFSRFSQITIERLAPIKVPMDSKDALWGNSIVIVKAIK